MKLLISRLNHFCSISIKALNLWRSSSRAIISWSHIVDDDCKFAGSSKALHLYFVFGIYLLTGFDSVFCVKIVLFGTGVIIVSLGSSDFSHLAPNSLSFTLYIHSRYTILPFQ